MLGILGGMGPLATADFMRKIVLRTPAAKDQDHFPIIAYSASQILDRTEFLLGKGPDPFPGMCAALRLLEAAGASVIAIPCNTAHFWYDRLQAEAKVRILHIAEAVIQELRLHGIQAGSIGVMATDGTIKAGIYQRRLIDDGYDCVLPDRQDRVMLSIRHIKAGRIEEARRLLLPEARALMGRGCRRLILGCTEIPIALNEESGEEIAPYLVDSADALARVVVDFELRETDKAPRRAG